jgi:hypothetical protein
VDDADGVRGRQPAPRLHERVDDPGPRRALGLEPSPEGRALDELHGHEHAFGGSAHVVDRDDVWMLQPRHRSRLAHEARRVAVGGTVQDLDGYSSVELGIVGGVDDAHAAAAEPLEHDVAADRVAALQRRGGRGPLGRRDRRVDHIAVFPVAAALHFSPYNRPGARSDRPL